MKRQVTMGEAIGFVIILAGMIVTSWVTISKDVARHDERIKALENTSVEIKSMLQKILDGQTALELKMENKQDRK